MKKYPEIWNIGAEEYPDRTKKRGAWINICMASCEGFDEKSEICFQIFSSLEIYNTVIKCQGRYRIYYIYGIAALEDPEVSCPISINPFILIASSLLNPSLDLTK